MNKFFIELRADLSSSIFTSELSKEDLTNSKDIEIYGPFKSIDEAVEFLGNLIKSKMS